VIRIVGSEPFGLRTHVATMESISVRVQMKS
jgi:hypothetical protein